MRMPGRDGNLWLCRFWKVQLGAIFLPIPAALAMALSTSTIISAAIVGPMAEWKHRIVMDFAWDQETPVAEHAQAIFEALKADVAMIDYVLESDEQAMDKYRGIIDMFDRTSAFPERKELIPLDEEEFDDILDELYDWGDNYRIVIG